ncbi:MAG: hypothetical protein WCX73_02250 [Candidatus Pacearchaeota archaeon]
MKKGINKKVLILPIFILTLLAINLTLVLAGPISSTGDFIDSTFYKTIEEWVVPSGMEGASGMIVGIITLLILFAIMYDIIMLVAPFSSTVNIIIAIGLGILMILFQWNLTVCAWVISVGASVFGWAAGAAALLTIVMAIAALFFIFFGGIKVQEWITGVRGRRRILEAEDRAYKSAASIVKGTRVLKEVGKHS